MPDLQKLIGSDWWSLTIILYLLGKFQDSCIFLPMDFEPLQEGEYEYYLKGGNLTSLAWVCTGDGVGHLVPPSILHKNDLDVALVEYGNFLQDCVEHSERMAVIPLSLKRKDTGGHANVLIYDKSLHTLERYDPNGVTNIAFCPEELDAQLEALFTSILGDLVYITPLDYCPDVGLQMREMKSRENAKIPVEKGFCSVWSFIYANLRLEQPDIDRETITSFITHELTEKRHPYEFMLGVIEVLSSLSEDLRHAKDITEAMDAIKDAVGKELF